MASISSSAPECHAAQVVRVGRNRAVAGQPDVRARRPPHTRRRSLLDTMLKPLSVSYKPSLSLPSQSEFEFQKRCANVAGSV